MCPQSCSCFIFTFHVFKGELGKREAKNKALTLTLARELIIVNVSHAVASRTRGRRRIFCLRAGESSPSLLSRQPLLRGLKLMDAQIAQPSVPRAWQG